MSFNLDMTKILQYMTNMFSSLSPFLLLILSIFAVLLLVGGIVNLMYRR